ncbi:MAG TPA: glycosyltransferase, partial [Jiangellaceae bacterium]
GSAVRGRYRVGAPGHTRRRSIRVRRRMVTALVLFAATAALVFGRWHTYGVASLYGLAVFVILGSKLLASLVPPRRWPPPDPRRRVGVIVTIYNEDPDLLRRCLDALLTQTFPVRRIVVVDDASADLAAYDVAAHYASADPRITVVRQRENRGKREALAVGFRAMAGEVDVYCCVDSDSVLEPIAVAEGVRPFDSRRITAVTGMVVPSNYTASLITRLQDIRYINAFLIERAAYSRLGSVLCVCGAIAFYRASVVDRHLEAFLAQRFLGRPAVVGDDRHLTNRCLTEGKVVLAEQSISHTAVPEKIGHFARQQVRWGRSFFRESLWALRHLPLSRPGWWLTLVELTQWFVFSTALVYIVVVHPILTGRLLIVEYLIFVGLMSLARSVRYFDLRRRGQTLGARLATFAVAPLYGYLALLVLLPLRFWSLATMRRTGWGTRKKVEVAIG